MKRDDWMLFILTFLTGAAIGMYVYVAVWKPVYAPENLGDEESQANEWSVVGKRRGGTSDEVQPSFRLLQSGEYIYVSGDMDEPKEGKVSKTLVRNITISESELLNYEQPVESTRCASDRGGYDYEYDYTISGRSYRLDTCDTSLGTDTALARSLENVWNSFNGAPRSYNSVAEWLEQWINRNVGLVKKEY